MSNDAIFEMYLGSHRIRERSRIKFGMTTLTLVPNDASRPEYILNLTKCEGPVSSPYDTMAEGQGVAGRL